MMRITAVLIFTLIVLTVVPAHAAVTIAYDTQSPPLRFAVSRLTDALAARGEQVLQRHADGEMPKADIVILSGDAAEPAGLGTDIRSEGYRCRVTTRQGARQIWILARDTAGAMYGVLDLAERVQNRGGLLAVGDTMENPRFPFRAIKFNLPWYPYRESEATALNLTVCRDLNYWRAFLDMMAENRFNTLTLWNMHPFTYMIRPQGYPEACPFTDAEMTEWRQFWTSLFQMAADRCIETYLINWNIVVTPEFAAAHHVQRLNDTSQIIKDYTRACVTQVINEYPGLTGLGVTLADWMNNIPPAGRQDWVEETFIAGIKQANRPAKFIHRSVLSSSPEDMRRVIDRAEFPDDVMVEVKFNWSHGHSTPQLALTHDDRSGQIMDGFWTPEPDNYKIAWMIRNEDIFILRWGEPDFIRRHISANGGSYVGGYFVGSEGYIPALDTSHRRQAHQTWQYAFEKQWLFYMTWGRLLYNPETPDAVFANAFSERYGRETGDRLLRAYTIGSRMPLRVASFHTGTWDFSLYSEGFLEPRKAGNFGYFDNVSPFISVDELIHHKTLDPQFLSIPDFVEAERGGSVIGEGQVTPLALAAALDSDAQELERILTSLQPAIDEFSGALECELLDLQAWMHLSRYFAAKLYGATALHRFRTIGAIADQQEAVQHLIRAANHWEDLARGTRTHYQPSPYVAGFRFAWENYITDAQRDIAIARTATIEQKFPYED